MEDRPGLFDDSPKLSDTQSDELVAYRPVSTAAVIGALLALVSCLSLVTPWLTGLPWVAALISCLGVRSVLASPETKTGLGLARVGLAIALFAGGATYARGWYRQTLYTQQAEPVATRFLELLAEGDAIGAMELTLRLDERRSSEALAKLHYASDEEAAKRLGEFREELGIAELLGAGEPPPVLANSKTERLRGGTLFSSWVYEVPAEGGEAPLVLSLRVERPRDPRDGGPTAWRVADFKTERRAD